MIDAERFAYSCAQSFRFGLQQKKFSFRYLVGFATPTDPRRNLYLFQ